MTRKDFQLLASALRQSMPMAHDGQAALIQWRRDVEAIVSVCSRFNPNFKPGLFRKACGIVA